MLQVLGTRLPTYLALISIIYASIFWAVRIYVWLAQSETSVSKGARSVSGLKILWEQRKQLFQHQYSQGIFQRHTELGRTFVTKLGGTTTIYTIDVANIRSITTSRFEEWGKSGWATVSEKCVGNGVLLNDGNPWKRSRTLLKPVFASFQPSHLDMILDKYTTAYLDEIRTLRGRVFSFHELASRFMFQVVGDIIWAESALWKTSHASSDRTKFLHHFSSLEEIFALGFNLGILALPDLCTRIPLIYRSIKGMRAYFKQRICRALESTSSDGLVDKCVTQILTETFGSVTELEGEIGNLFFASFDTTTALLSNLVHVISSRADIQRKLRLDVAFLGGQPPSQADIAKCKYLRHTLLETMRLFTPVTYHCRQAKVDTILPLGAGINGQAPLPVSRGSNVVWSVYSLNRDHKIWGHDSEEFKPDRWQNSLMQEHFMPFGSGPRQCPGQVIAQHMVSYIIIRMMQSFDRLEYAGNHDFEEALAVSFFDKYGTLVSMQ